MTFHLIEIQPFFDRKNVPNCEGTVFSTLQAVHGTAYSRCQMRMDAILKECPRIMPIANDVCIFGKGEEVQDANMHNLMRAARKYSITFNLRKAVVKQNCDKYMMRFPIFQIKQTLSKFEDPSSLSSCRPDHASVSSLSGRLFQGHPLAVCSKTLTEPEPQYANIEREIPSRVARAVVTLHDTHPCSPVLS